MFRRNFSKYHTRKAISSDGKKFDSNAELRRYNELRLTQQAGKISNLERQIEFTLQPAFTKNGKKWRAITYRADFQYIDSSGVVVEDVKGFATPEFKLKQKMFEFKFPNLTLKITR